MKPSICDLCTKPIPVDEAAVLVNMAPEKWRHIPCVRALEAVLKGRGITPYKHPIDRKALRRAEAETRAQMKASDASL